MYQENDEIKCNNKVFIESINQKPKITSTECHNKNTA